MNWRRAEVSLSTIVIVVGLAGCTDSTGPDDDPDGRFGIGNSSSFVTTGGASGDPSEEITFIVDEFTQRMSFNAKGGAVATGVFNFTGRVLGVNTHLHGDIVCYAIDGNAARVAGHITTADPPLPPGVDQDAIWIVQDNGEGSDDPDRISLYFTVPHAPGTTNCVTAEALLLTMYDIKTGNVQVHN